MQPSAPTVAKLNRKAKPSVALGFIKGAIRALAGVLLAYFILCMIGPQYDFLGIVAELKESTITGALDNQQDKPKANTPEQSESVPDQKDPIEEGSNASQESTSAPDAEQSPASPTFEDRANHDGVPADKPPLKPTETKQERLDRFIRERDDLIDKGDLELALVKEN